MERNLLPGGREGERQRAGAGACALRRSSTSLIRVKARRPGAAA
ncbi:hypothetical protein [Planobispora rosea]|nr:hypothetical protein [Planobispora rosea]